MLILETPVLIANYLTFRVVLACSVDTISLAKRYS